MKTHKPGWVRAGAANTLVVVQNEAMSQWQADAAHGSDRATEELRLLEALLFAAGEPLDETMLARSASRRGQSRRRRLRSLADEYATRGVNLVRVGKKWTFRTADRSVVAADPEADRRDAQAVARGCARRSPSWPITSR